MGNPLAVKGLMAALSALILCSAMLRNGLHGGSFLSSVFCPGSAGLYYVNFESGLYRTAFASIIEALSIWKNLNHQSGIDRCGRENPVSCRKPRFRGRRV